VEVKWQKQLTPKKFKKPLNWRCFTVHAKSISHHQNMRFSWRASFVPRIRVRSVFSIARFTYYALVVVIGQYAYHLVDYPIFVVRSVYPFIIGTPIADVESDNSYLDFSEHSLEDIMKMIAGVEEKTGLKGVPGVFTGTRAC
jgi:hypothetical protein